jgi:YD repeat-containing protein
MRKKMLVGRAAMTMLAAGCITFTAAAQQHLRTVQMTYHDNVGLWVLGQVATQTINGIGVESVGFDPGNALPLTRSEFGRLTMSMSYNADGTLASSRDAAGNATGFENWKRGIPQKIVHADGTSINAAVNDQGLITQVTDENGSTTSYGYDSMGRVSSITPPSADTVAWTPTTQAFEQVAVPEQGISGGHWRQTVTTGNAVKVTYFDALWRPLIVWDYDAARVAETQTYSRFAYDSGGRTVFASYPSATPNPASGVWTGYDAVGRAISVAQDSEQGLLITTTAYLADGAGPYTVVTEPGGQQTRTWYQSFGTPAYDTPVRIQRPEGDVTSINRDVFGKLLSIYR